MNKSGIYIDMGSSDYDRDTYRIVIYYKGECYLKLTYDFKGKLSENVRDLSVEEITASDFDNAEGDGVYTLLKLRESSGDIYQIALNDIRNELRLRKISKIIK